MRLIDADAMEKRRIDYIVNGYAESVNDMTEWGMALIEAPTVGGWIPCSERLPDTEVLCCDKYRAMIIAYVYEDDTSDTGFSAESETQYMYNCIAWMPMPEPYKED